MEAKLLIGSSSYENLNSYGTEKTVAYRDIKKGTDCLAAGNTLNWDGKTYLIASLRVTSARSITVWLLPPCPPGVDYSLYCGKNRTFYHHDDFQDYLRKSFGQWPDYVVVNNMLFTVENYDSEGKEVIYGNLKHQKTLTVTTSDRYGKTGRSDAVVELSDLFSYRNDINYAE